MKRLMTTMAVMVMIVTSAAAMSFSKARKEALFLSDKMAYELSLSLSQYEAVYEINLDYFLSLYDPADLDGVFWLRRNADLRYVLSPWQWQMYTGIVDFYRPMSWVRRHTFNLVLRNRYSTNHFFFDRPTIYYSFRGGHNTGYDSYYAGRDFHRPAAPNAKMHYGSSAPAAHGTTRPTSKANPSYHFNDTKTVPVTSGANRPQTFSGSQRGNSTTRSNVGNVTQRSTTTTTTTSHTTTRTSGSTRGNTGGSRGR